MKHYSALVCAIILLITVACAPVATPTNAPALPPLSAAVATPKLTSGTALPTSPRATTPTVEPTLAPNPLNVKVKLDDKLTSSAVISSTGGIVSVKAADGTQFTLTIPKSALFGDERITLTLVTGVEGLPFSGGLIGAVQMAPEGLRLFQPAILTIQSPTAISATGFQTVAFAYHASGEGLHLNPSEAKTHTLAVEVWHFSGTGAAKGTEAEIQAQQRRVPANAEDAFRQRMQDYLGRERQAQLLTGNADPDFGKKMIGFLREAYQSLIAPQLPLAAKDCEAAREILSRAIGWARQVELMGAGDEFATEIANIWKTYEDAIVNCYDKEYDQCLIDKDIKHRATMLGLLRQATLLSPSAGGGLLARLDASKVDKCPPRYKIEGVYWGAYNLTGTICDGLGKPFVLSADANLAGAHMVGQFTLTPTGTSAGNWNFAGAMEGLPVDATGVFSMEGVATGIPVILMGSGSWAATAPAPIGRVPLGPGGEHLGTTERIELKLTSEECPLPNSGR